jgi:hypothetical protein
VPPILSAREVARAGGDRDPLCGAQTTGDADDGGWVLCPMVADAAIALGCCLDYQAAARSPLLKGRQSRTLFDAASEICRASPLRLQRTCLDHQAAIARADLDRCNDPGRVAAIQELLGRIGRAHASLKESAGDAGRPTGSS